MALGKSWPSKWQLKQPRTQTVIGVLQLFSLLYRWGWCSILSPDHVGNKDDLKHSMLRSYHRGVPVFSWCYERYRWRWVWPRGGKRRCWSSAILSCLDRLLFVQSVHVSLWPLYLGVIDGVEADYFQISWKIKTIFTKMAFQVNMSKHCNRGRGCVSA